MSFIPPVWHSVAEWMRQVAEAINPLIKSWPRVTFTGAIGYEDGAGGAVTQTTSKSTAVELHAACGRITLHSATLAGDTTVAFTLTNDVIEAGDLLILNHVSGGTAGAYLLNAQCGAGSASISVRNVTTGSLGESIIIGFAVFKAVSA